MLCSFFFSKPVFSANIARSTGPFALLKISYTISDAAVPFFPLGVVFFALSPVVFAFGVLALASRSGLCLVPGLDLCPSRTSVRPFQFVGYCINPLGQGPQTFTNSFEKGFQFSHRRLPPINVLIMSVRTKKTVFVQTLIGYPASYSLSLFSDIQALFFIDLAHE